MKQSYYLVVKPEGLMYWEDLIGHIESKWKLSDIKTFKYTKEIVDGLYPETDDKLKEAITAYFHERNGIVFEIDGDDISFEKIIEFTGKETNPDDCEPNSTRKIFGHPIPFFQNGVPLYYNIVHRPKNKKENAFLGNIFSSA